MRMLLRNWAKVALILVPLLVVALDAAILIGEHLQSDTEKALRLASESRSRKEGFTVQQYLYTTVYYRRTNGEPVDIEGWRAGQPHGAGTPITVEFVFTDTFGRHVATWDVDVQKGAVTPRSEAADYISWR